jgi:aminoglycoside 3-N-acetyltransferase
LVGSAELRGGIRRLSLPGKAVCVHSSLRSFGHVEGGADTVVDAFLAEGCTLLVPTFSFTRFLVAAPPGTQFDRNGWSAAWASTGGEGLEPFSPETNELGGGMGAIPRAVLGRRDRVRGDHPLMSFAALGPDAAELVRGQTPLDVFAPFEALAAAAGSILLAGVGLTSMTLLHLAEQRAGRRLFVRWANSRDGHVLEARVGGCGSGFDAFDPVLAGIARETAVGSSRWRAYPAAETLELAAAAIRADPGITRCADPACARCRDAIAGGPFRASA